MGCELTGDFVAGGVEVGSVGFQKALVVGAGLQVQVAAYESAEHRRAVGHRVEGDESVLSKNDEGGVGGLAGFGEPSELLLRVKTSFRDAVGLGEEVAEGAGVFGHGRRLVYHEGAKILKKMRKKIDPQISQIYTDGKNGDVGVAGRSEVEPQSEGRGATMNAAARHVRAWKPAPQEGGHRGPPLRQDEGGHGGPPLHGVRR